MGLECCIAHLSDGIIGEEIESHYQMRKQRLGLKHETIRYEDKARKY